MITIKPKEIIAVGEDMVEMAPVKDVAVLTVEEVGAHVPCDAGAGVWETLSIPFSAFKETFQHFS